MTFPRTDHGPARSIGIVGGLGALGAADIFFKLVKATPGHTGREQPSILFEQHPFPDSDSAGDEAANQSARKLYAFNTLKGFEGRGVEAAVLPCFVSHTFIDELQAALQVPIVNIMAALRQHLARRHAGQRRIGVLTSDYVRRQRLFERYLEADGLTLLYPGAEAQRDGLMAAVYGPRGIKAGHWQGESVERLVRAAEDLLAQGAEVIVPGCTEIGIVIDALRERGLPVLDSNQVYAQYAVSQEGGLPARAFKVGVVGGVGPAATVDFMDKIIRNTTARRDQEHVKLVVEHNPQIPDRTENLVGSGTDPTIALYATCKKLEAADADIIAIPCNTAHAFVERIQPYLGIPVVNMLYETVEHIRRIARPGQIVGLLATDGTLASRVYHDAIAPSGLPLLVPDEVHQRLVTSAIYGEQGVKAGHTQGRCREELEAALAHLVTRGADIIILGCTELPLLIAQTDAWPVAGRTVGVLDPTEILARKCVALAGRGGVTNRP